MKVRKYCAPPCDVVRIGLHTSVWTISKSCETLVVLSLGNDVLWCLLLMHHSQSWCNGTSFKFMPSTMASNSLRLAILRWPSLLMPKLRTFIQRIYNVRRVLAHLQLRRYKFLSLCASATTPPRASFTLQPSLSNSTLKPSKMSLLTEMTLFFIFGTWRTWVMVVCDNLPLTCIVALMFPLPMASKTVSSPWTPSLGKCAGMW